MMDSLQVPLVINDRIDVAIACGADGAHIGQEDLPVAQARRLLGPNKILGVSCKTVEHALKAEADGADYIGSGAGNALCQSCACSRSRLLDAIPSVAQEFCQPMEQAHKAETEGAE